MNEAEIHMWWTNLQRLKYKGPWWVPLSLALLLHFWPLLVVKHIIVNLQTNVIIKFQKMTTVLDNKVKFEWTFFHHLPILQFFCKSIRITCGFATPVLNILQNLSFLTPTYSLSRDHLIYFPAHHCNTNVTTKIWSWIFAWRCPGKLKKPNGYGFSFRYLQPSRRASIDKTIKGADLPTNWYMNPPKGGPMRTPMASPPSAMPMALPLSSSSGKRSASIPMPRKKIMSHLK